MARKAARETGEAAPKRNYIAEYNAEIKAGRVRVGKHIKAIYKILTDGIAKGVYKYDPAKAEKAIRFIENFCHHSEGRNDLLKLELLVPVATFVWLSSPKRTLRK